MPSSGSLALGLGAGGVAALFIISGVKGESISDVLEGKAELSKPSGQTTPATEAISGEAEAQTEEAYHDAPNPIVAGNTAKTAGDCAAIRKLSAQIEAYREKIETEVRAGSLSSQIGQSLFLARYPEYLVYIGPNGLLAQCAKKATTTR